MAYVSKIKSKFFSHDSEKIQDADVLAERKRRVLLVIKARWAIMASYIIYAAIAATWFATRFPKELSERFFIYGLGLLCLVAYNAFLHYSYERLSAFKGIAQLQMIIDVLITTLIVYFTGGTASWFWSTYLLIILQSAFLFDRKIDTLEIAALAGLSFGILTVFQQTGVVGRNDLYFVLARYSKDATYEGLKVFWVVASSLAVAVIASYLMGVIRQREQQLAKKSITDGLTGLYNHSYFHKRLDSEMERSKRYSRTFSLVLIDFDDFKQYNDSFGHLDGDKLLRDVAEIFKDNVRSHDVDSVFRYGGEEFAIIAPETSSQEIGTKESGAVTMAKRIRAQIEENLPITISVGIASFPHHGDSATALFKAADVALYRAKEKGKNCVVIFSNALLDKKSV